MIEVNIDNIDKSVTKVTNEFLLQVSNELINLIKEEVPINSGQLRQSFHIIGTREEGVYIVGSRLKHAVYVYAGTKPHYPPIEPIKKWVRRKLNQDESVAYAVQHKIGQEGTEGNKYIDRAIKRLRDRYG